MLDNVLGTVLSAFCLPDLSIFPASLWGTAYCRYSYCTAQEAEAKRGCYLPKATWPVS